MSSMIMRIIISYSKTSRRRPERDLSITGSLLCRNVDRADQAVRPVVKMHHGFQLMGQTAFNHLRAEDPVGQWGDRRPGLLLPVQNETVSLRCRLNCPCD